MINLAKHNEREKHKYTRKGICPVIYMDGKLRNRPTMLMNSVRPKSTIFKFKVWPQKRSQNLSCNLAQTLLRILPISGVLEGQMT